MIVFNGLKVILTHELYFFTGNVVQVYKINLLDLIERFIRNHNLIIALFIAPEKPSLLCCGYTRYDYDCLS
ncbi:unnamed protein product [Commensalibacter communis]|nr:unnamed protein product [Commensalibacter communis]CAI3935227.1 unnamed protein product [Commensalibacter communis]